jgi:CheY-like chemotaxis protein
MDGTEAARQIRAIEAEYAATHPEHEPVLLIGLTGNVEDGNLKLYEEVGMNGCVLKGSLLTKAMQIAVDRHEANANEFISPKYVSDEIQRLSDR